MAGECRWRPRKYQVDPWSRGREVARGVLPSSPKREKRSIFCHRRGIEKFRYVFSTHQRPNVFVSDAWPAPATYHRSFCEHCDQRMGQSPSRARPVQISWRSHWCCRSMSVEDSESRRFEQHLAGFFPGRSWPKICPGFFFGVGGVAKFDTFFSKICAHSERCINLLAGIF